MLSQIYLYPSRRRLAEGLCGRHCIHSVLFRLDKNTMRGISLIHMLVVSRMFLRRVTPLSIYSDLPAWRHVRCQVPHQHAPVDFMT